MDIQKYAGIHPQQKIFEYQYKSFQNLALQSVFVEYFKSSMIKKLIFYILRQIPPKNLILRLLI